MAIPAKDHGSSPGFVSPIKIALIYFIISALWIFFSDYAVHLIFSDPDIILNVSIAKGWFFISAVSVLIFVLVTRDTNKQYELNSRLSKSEKEYKAIVHTSRGLIFSINKETRIDFVNDYCQELLGYTAEEMTGMPFLDLIADEYKDRATARFRNYSNSELQTGKDFETKLKGKDGRIVDVISNSVTKTDESGNFSSLTGFIVDVTERNKIQEELKRSEKKYRNLVNSSQGLIWNVDTNGVIRYISKNSFDFYGLDPELLVGRNIMEYIHPDDVQDRMKIFTEHFMTGKVDNYSTEDRILHPDGRIVYLLSFGVINRSENGEITGISGTSLDITERKLAESKIYESEEKYRTLVETLHGVLWRVDETGRIKYISEGCYDLLGMKPSQLLEKKFSFTIHDQNKFFYKLRIRAKEKNNKAEFENIFVHQQTGEERSFLNHVVFKYDENGVFRGITGNSVDITEIRNQEKKLKQSEEKYRTLTEVSNGMIWSIDNDGKLTFVNRSVTETLGYEYGELIGKRPIDLMLEEDKESALDLMKSLIREGKPLIGYESRLVAKNGNVVNALFNTAPIFDSNGKVQGRIATILDITQWKKAETEIKKSEEKYKNLIETSQGLIWSLNTAGEFTFVSKNAIDYYGIEAEDLIGRKTFDFMYPENAERAKDDLKRFVESGAISGEPNEDTICRPDGRIVNLLERITIVKDAEGKITGIMGTSLDITDRKKAEKKNKEISDYIKLLYEASRKLNATLDFDVVYKTVCESLAALIPCNSVFISSFDEVTELITCRAYWGVDGMKDVSNIPVLKLNHENHGSQSEAIRTGNSIFINDLQKNKEIYKNGYFISEKGEVKTEVPDDSTITRSALIVPLKSGGKINGAIQILNNDANAYTEDQLQILESLSMHIASAQQNAILYQQAQKEISERRNAEKAIQAYSEQTKVLYEIGQKLNLTLDVSDICRSIFLSLKNIVPSDSLVLSSFEEESNLIVFRGYYIDSGELDVSNIPPIPLGEGLQSTAIKTGEPMLVNDYDERIKKNKNIYYVLETGDVTENSPPESDIIRSAIVVPLKIHGKVTGVMQLLSFEKDKYNGEQLKLVESLSNYVSAAQQNALLYNRVNEELIERKRALESLRISEEKYRNAVDTSQGFIWILNKKGEFTFVSGNAKDYYGIEASELLGRSTFEFMKPEAAEISRKLFDKIIKTGKRSHESTEDTILRPDGKIVHVIDKATILKDANGKVIGTMGTSLDITAIKEVENRVLESERRYHVIFESTGTATLIVEEDTTISLANRECVDLTGYNADELIGKKWTEFVAPESLEIMMQNHILRRSDSELAPAKYEVNLVDKAGETRNALLDIGVIEETKQSIVSIIDITEQKRANEALRMSEEKYRNLIDASQGLILSMDLEGRITYVNKKAKDFYGLEPEELYGRYFYEFKRPERKKIHKENYLSFVKTGIFKQVFDDDEIVRPDGRKVSIFSTGILLRDENGNPSGFMGTALDVTESRQAEEKIRQSEEKHRKLVETAYEGIWEIDADYRTIFLNKRLAQMLGYDQEEMLGKSLFDFSFAEDIDELEKKLNRRKRGVSELYEFCLKNKNGQGIWVLLSVNPLKNAKGKFSGVLAMVTDITEWKETQLALAGSEKKHRDIVETANEAIMMYDENETITFVNKKFCEMFGQSYKEVIGKNVYSIILSEQKTFLKNQIETRRSGKNTKYEFLNTKKDGTKFWTMNSASPLIDKEGKYRGSLSMLTDINEWKLAQIALEQSEFFFRESQQAAKVGSYKTDFVQGRWSSSEVLDEIFGIDINYDRSINGWLEIIHPDDREMMNDYLNKEVIANQIRFDREYRIVRKNDGETRWVYGLGNVTFDSKGNILLMMGTIQDITERKLIDTRLKESEEYYRTLVETSPYAISVVDLDGKLIFGNKQAAEMHGYESPEEMKSGLKIFDLIAPSDIEVANEYFRSNIESGILENKELNFIKKDGSIFPVEITASVLRDQEGRPSAVLSIIQDISERKAIELSLRESEAYYRTLVDTLPVGIVVIGTDGSVSYTSEQTNRMFALPVGYDPRGTRFEQWVAAEHIETAAQRLKSIKDGEISVSVQEYEVLRYGGAKFWVEITSTPYFDSENNLKGTLILIQDITAKKEIERRINESETRYKTLLETIPVGIVQVDLEGKIKFFSPQVENMFLLPEGYEPSNSNFMEWVDPKEVALSLERFGNVVSTGDFSNSMYDYTLIRYDKTTFIGNTNTAPHYDEKGALSGVLISIQDITEIRRAQQELEENKKRLDSILATAMDAIITTDESRHIVLFNKAAEKLFKYESSEVLGMDINVLIPERFHNIHNVKMEIFGKTAKTARNLGDLGQLVGMTSDNSEIPVEISISKAKIGDNMYFTSIVRDVTQRIKYETELKSNNEKLHLLAAHMQKIREEERLLISREIHDQLGQDLTALKMDIVMMAKEIEKKDKEIERDSIALELRGMAELSDKTIKWVRRLATELRPDVLDKLGLFDAIEWHAHEFEERNRVVCDTALSGSEEDINKDQAIVLFRIFQEALTNVLRHSEAKKVKVHLSVLDNSINLRLEDNGKGISDKDMAETKSLGIVGMKERAFLLGGNVIITGEKKKGTIINVTIPKLIKVKNEQ